MLRLKGNEVVRASVSPHKQLPACKSPLPQVQARQSSLLRFTLTVMIAMVLIWFAFMSKVMWSLNDSQQTESTSYAHLFKRIDVVQYFKQQSAQLQAFSSVKQQVVSTEIMEDLTLQEVLKLTWPDPDEATTAVLFAPSQESSLKQLAQFQHTLKSLCLQNDRFSHIWLLIKHETIQQVTTLQDQYLCEFCNDDQKFQLINYVSDAFWISQIATISTPYTLLVMENGLSFPDKNFHSTMKVVSTHFENRTNFGPAVFGSFGYQLPVQNFKFDHKAQLEPVPSKDNFHLGFMQVDVLSDVWFYKTSNLSPMLIQALQCAQKYDISGDIKPNKMRRRSKLRLVKPITQSFMSKALLLWSLLTKSQNVLPKFVVSPLKSNLSFITPFISSWSQFFRRMQMETLPSVPVSLQFGKRGKELALVIYNFDEKSLELNLKYLSYISVLMTKLRNVMRHVVIIVTYHKSHHFQRRPFCIQAAAQLGFPPYACFQPWISFQFVEFSEVWLQHHLNILNPDITIASAELSFISQLNVVYVLRDHWRHMHWFGSLSTRSLQNWSLPSTRINVITYRRPVSLNRLINSLQTACYLGDNVHLYVHMEAKADQATVNMVRNINWLFGSFTIRRRVYPGGLMVSTYESWYPSDNHTYSIILEDDVEVSPLFYIWAKLNLLKYRYGEPSDYSSRLYGISLYTPRMDEMKFPISLIPHDERVKPQYQPFLYQTPCSWGAVYFPELWTEVIDYMHSREPDPFLFRKIISRKKNQEHVKLAANEIFVPGSRSNFWISSWKKFLIELLYMKGYVMLYPNFYNQTSFSTNHLEIGEHQKYAEQNQKLIGIYELPLMQDHPNSFAKFEKEKQFSASSEDLWMPQEATFAKLDATSMFDLPNQILPAFSEMTVLNLFSNVSSMDQLEQQGLQFQESIRQQKLAEQSEVKV